MQNVILIVHLLLALSLIGVVLMQRSEGGGLGMGGGGGGGAMSARGAATALGKLTWILAAAFICTSLTLTILAAADGSGTSIMDRFTGDGGAAEESGGTAGDGLDTDALLPPPSAGSEDEDGAPLVPRAD
ncbi:preprotein translocase subunit SecG [Roseivivax sediminis]|uniref:Protein-export membrane protein SecG n=1 Tax=Roseivivax sediminis TaxID=936889 RepID=A0A1I2AUC5_9RHOB|nr:preprotein translocase subunit SecG [Roseivivax sediminis]SFE47605.1 protein translocase subunit secG [Roseivivax sediminis]